MNVWLIIVNPYAYDEAMYQAQAQAKASNCDLNVVFLVDEKSIGNVLHDIGEHGLFGLGAIHNLQSSLSSGYHKLGENVLRRVERKVTEVDLKIQGIVEGIPVQDYVKKLIAEGVIKIFLALTKASSVTELEPFLENLKIIQEG